MESIIFIMCFRWIIIERNKVIFSLLVTIQDKIKIFSNPFQFSRKKIKKRIKWGSNIAL